MTYLPLHRVAPPTCLPGSLRVVFGRRRQAYRRGAMRINFVSDPT